MAEKKRNRRGLSSRFLVVIRQHLSDLVRGSVIAQVVQDISEPPRSQCNSVIIYRLEPHKCPSKWRLFCIFLRKNIYCRQHFGCSPTDYRKKLQQKLHWKGGAAACPLRRLQKHANASFLSVQSVISLFAIFTSLLFRKYYWAQRNPKMECL